MQHKLQKRTSLILLKILVGSEESRCLLCSAYHETQGKGGKQHVVLHTSWWPGRMVHTHWSSIRILVTVVWHIINSPSPSLWAKMGTAGNRGKHSEQYRQLMIQSRLSEGSLLKSISNCIRRQLYHNNVLLYVGTIRQAILAPFVTIIEL